MAFVWGDDGLKYYRKMLNQILELKATSWKQRIKPCNSSSCGKYTATEFNWKGHYITQTSKLITSLWQKHKTPRTISANQKINQQTHIDKQTGSSNFISPTNSSSNFPSPVWSSSDFIWHSSDFIPPSSDFIMFLEMMTRQVDILRKEYPQFHFEEVKTFHFNIRIVKAQLI